MVVQASAERVEPRLRDLRRAVEAYRNGPARVAPAEELVDLRHLIDLLELEFSRMAAEFASTNRYREDGSLTAVQWIRHNCHMSIAAAVDNLTVGESGDNLPQSVAATEAGQIGFAHLALLARTGREIEQSATGQSFDENTLLPAARRSSVSRFRHLCQHARHVQDPEGYERSEVAAVEARRLEFSNAPNGGVWLGGFLDSAGGAAVRSALEPLATRTGEHDARRRNRRLADALVELAVHSMDTGRSAVSPTHRAHLQVTSTLETLLAAGGAPAAEQEFSLPVSRKVVERLGCDSSVTRVLLAGDSSVIDVGRAHRVVPAATRKALHARDQGCRWPGCERPPSWTAAHHLVHWAQGGRTDLENLVLLCHRHHWMVHEGGWQLVRSDGDYHTIPPPVRLGGAPTAPVPLGRRARPAPDHDRNAGTVLPP
ncbi:MAG: HNH endonuclease [Candidatus Dormibacteria bacterium]